MDLTSPDFEEDAPIPREHTCDGPDTPPELHWGGVPSGVGGLALTWGGPEAPGGALVPWGARGGTFVQWGAWGIDPSSGRLRADDGPRIGQGRNGFGSDGYHGPCPPPGHGPHSYEFRLTALDESLDLAPGSAIEDLRSAIDG